jgi:hypothetical protein
LKLPEIWPLITGLVSSQPADAGRAHCASRERFRGRHAEIDSRCTVLQRRSWCNLALLALQWSVRESLSGSLPLACHPTRLLDLQLPPISLCVPSTPQSARPAICFHRDRAHISLPGFRAIASDSVLLTRCSTVGLDCQGRSTEDKGTGDASTGPATRHIHERQHQVRLAISQ